MLILIIILIIINNFADWAKKITDKYIYTQYRIISDSVHGIANLSNVSLDENSLVNETKTILVKKTMNIIYLQPIITSPLNIVMMKIISFYY